MIRGDDDSLGAKKADKMHFMIGIMMKRREKRLGVARVYIVKLLVVWVVCHEL